MNRKLKTIPEPKKGTQTVYASKTLPVIKSKGGNTTYLCGNCRAKTRRNYHRRKIQERCFEVSKLQPLQRSIV